MDSDLKDALNETNEEQIVELHKYRCEVREFIRLGVKDGRSAVEARLNRFAATRGQDAIDRLRVSIYRQRSLGNDGEQDKWIADDRAQQQ